jgi:hypothetical protein
VTSVISVLAGIIFAGLLDLFFFGNHRDNPTTQHRATHNRSIDFRRRVRKPPLGDTITTRLSHHQFHNSQRHPFSLLYQLPTVSLKSFEKVNNYLLVATYWMFRLGGDDNDKDDNSKKTSCGTVL